MEREKKGLRKLMDSCRGYLLVAFFTVTLYSFYQNYNHVMAVIGKVLGVLSPLFWGLAIAFVVNMPMRFLESKVFRRWKNGPLKRGVCLTMGFLFVLAVVALIMQMIVPRVVESAEIIITNFDSYIVSLDEFGSALSERFNLTNSDIKWLESTLQSIFDFIDEVISEIVPMALRLTVNIASVTINGLLAVIMSYYALFNKEKHIEQAKRMVHALCGDSMRDQILTVCSRTNRSLNNYFFGMILECAILGVMCFVGMTIFRFPYALLISVIVGMTQIVPVVGPWFSAFLGALIILMVNPVMALWFLVFIVIVQQLECNLVYPRVVGNMVGLAGIWVMIAVLLGGGLFGVPGMVLCVPLMAVAQTLVREWVDHRISEKESSQAPEEPLNAPELAAVAEAAPQPSEPAQKANTSRKKRRK